MTAEGHLSLSIVCAVFVKNVELTPVLARGDWWHIVPFAVLTCLLSDIDHPKSLLGQRLSWISKPVAWIFDHRGLTHSPLAVFGALTLFYLKVPDSWTILMDILQGLVLGYLSHVLADMLTPTGVSLLWPRRWRFRLLILALRKGNRLERALCMTLFVYAVWMPQTLADSSTIRWSSGVINSLQVAFNRFISHRGGR